MTFEIAPGQQPRTFLMKGELDVAETETFLAGVGDVGEGGDVILELGDLAFIDSSGVRALVALEATRPAIRIEGPSQDERQV
jgi:anti-anti-sigma regulatory factor